MGRRERPVDPMAGPLEAFAFDLRLLRTKAGEPSYRKLAQRAGVSASALSAAAGGVVLPSRRVTLAYVAACGADIKEWALRWEALREQLARTQTTVHEWHLPPLELADMRMSELIDAMWQQWVQGCMHPAIEDTGLIAPRMTGGDGKPIDIAALVGVLRGHRRVVLIGPPGIGKSVISLAIVRELITIGAEPLPVVIPLCGLPMPPQALNSYIASLAWRCDQIVSRYGTSRELTESWLESGQLLPVFDGLDALPEAVRSAYVSALKTVHPCLITCRTGVYEMVASELGPHEVINVQPLSPIQVQQHLSTEHDQQLAELLTTPAFLRVALRMPQCETTDYQAICAAFARARLLDYEPHQIWHWLSWMAQFPVFDPGRPPVDMLSQQRHRWLARYGVIGVVAVAALAVIAGTARLTTGWWHDHQHDLAATSITGLVAAIVCLAGVKSVARLRRALILWLLVRQNAIPRDLTRFLHLAHNAALLDQSSGGYSFAHPQLRQYFLEGHL